MSRLSTAASAGCLLLIASVALTAQASEKIAAPTTQTSPETLATNVSTSDAPINLWVRNAPMAMVASQLAQLSGMSLHIDGVLEDQKVSGRFTGTLEQNLSSLSRDYGVLFDVDETTVSAVAEQAGASVSIALAQPEFAEALEADLSPDTLAGNEVEFREDAVRVAGHPAFVRRTARRITGSLAELGSSLDAVAAIAAAMPTSQEVENAVLENPVQASALEAVETEVAESAQVSALETAETEVVESAQVSALEQTGPESEGVIPDSGTTAMVKDIAEESLPANEQARLSKPIRWVTDIPGFETF